MQIPFIIWKDDEFYITEEAIKFLNKLKNKKLGIIAICGKYRTGKSYFINKVLLE